MTSHKQYLSPEELAELLGVPIQTVYRWNHVGSGPPVIRVGRLVRYSQEDIDAWLAGRKGKAA